MARRGLQNNYGIDRNLVDAPSLMPGPATSGTAPGALTGFSLGYNMARQGLSDYHEGQAGEAGKAAGLEEVQVGERPDQSPYYELNPATGKYSLNEKGQAGYNEDDWRNQDPSGTSATPDQMKRETEVGISPTRYGLGPNPEKWQETKHTADQKRAAVLEAKATYYETGAGSTSPNAGNKAEVAREVADAHKGRMDTKILTALQLGAAQRESDAAIKSLAATPELATLMAHINTMPVGSPEYKTSFAQLQAKVIEAYGQERGGPILASHAALRASQTALQTAEATMKWKEAAKKGLPGMMAFYDGEVKDGMKSTTVKDDKGLHIMRTPVGEDGKPTGPATLYQTFKGNSDYGMTPETEATLHLHSVMDDPKSMIDILRINATATGKSQHNEILRALYGARSAGVEKPSEQLKNKVEYLVGVIRGADPKISEADAKLQAFREIRSGGGQVTPMSTAEFESLSKHAMERVDIKFPALKKASGGKNPTAEAVTAYFAAVDREVGVLQDLMRTHGLRVKGNPNPGPAADVGGDGGTTALEKANAAMVAEKDAMARDAPSGSGGYWARQMHRDSLAADLVRRYREVQASQPAGHSVGLMEVLRGKRDK